MLIDFITPTLPVDRRFNDAQLLERESLLDLCSLIVCPPQKAAAASLIIVGDDMLAKQMQLAVMTSDSDSGYSSRSSVMTVLA